MRTFIAIDVPEKISGEILKIQNRLPEFNGKLTEPENLHLTLKFLGEINDDKVEEVRTRLKEIEYKKFETGIGYLGFFDNVKKGKRYGPVWLHLSNCEGLQKIVDESLKGLFEKEKRFMSHLTIARVKIFGDKEYFLGELGKIKMPEIKFEVDTFKLKKSGLGQKGPIYDDIEVYNLGRGKYK